jgi:hypothetical protein
VLLKKLIIIWKILIGNYEGEKLLWRRRHMWEFNIEMNVKEVERVGVN